ncbi:hypothetical protein EVAR_4900_1 [Eumeta japonica]|uniref:Uncharacterized protein n=1 Tax=Eumeta variegata TaxID=151549 RepID=A0A4C1XWH1_EUMVA|nr:hypothetical protein EVAR_4900_1 [Eumeta japonica]
MILEESSRHKRGHIRGAIVRVSDPTNDPGLRRSSTPLFLRVQVRDGGLMLSHARASSCRRYDPDGPVVMAPFQGSKLEDFLSQPEINRSCQWVHRHRLRPSRPSLESDGEVVGCRSVRTGETRRWRT